MLKVEVIGHIGKAAEACVWDGREFVQFPVAHKANNKGANGEWQQVTEWVQVSWRGNGGRLLPYLKKGTKVFIRGELKPQRYKNAYGELQISLKVIASEVILCGVRNETQTAV
ncbi:single-stranded DNA-binding protein [Alloprevotella tannerae]|uniref:single-stranded DNA-binding protein n=1 Tax=Alloprevotella tannerae TaxID=76122 RepID=UPI00204DB1A4|nr:single-stranded DNA-binding protein [Alloprevotella tannerae]DAJ17894.1 MAG TPA: Single strand binding protein [Podoviridae sp. ctgx11]